MINRIIDWSVANKLIVFAAVLIACIAGWWATLNTPLDAIPDLSETQVIIYSHWDRSPDLVESQVTAPIVAAMMGAPHVKTVRGISDFGYSYVYVIFDDSTDLYWARSRTTEYLASALRKLPPDCKTDLGPDATSLGWIFQYVLVDPSGKHSLAELRSYQDWYLRQYLTAVPGVAEIAPIGGFVRQYQVEVDPRRLLAYAIPLSRVVDAVRENNSDASGRWLEFGGSEYMIRGRGYARSLSDFENIPITANGTDPPIRIKDIGKVGMGPELRRGVADLNGTGEAVSGIVVMRSGENANTVIERVKARIKEIQPGLPPGVKIIPIYDRSLLIHDAIVNVRTTMIEITLTIIIIVLLFLWHLPSAIIPIVTLPAAVLISLLPFHMMDVSMNIMSMAGLAIAFGELIDASIVVVEQTHKKLEWWQASGSRYNYQDVVLSAIKEVAGPTFFALIIIAVSFLPVLTLEAQEGRMFRPLALAKTMALVAAAILALTLDPALRMLLTRTESFTFHPSWLRSVANTILVGRIQPEERHPLSRFLMRTYEPVVDWTLRHKFLVLATGLALVLVTIPVALSLGTEFMPPLDEGTLLYMPSTMPGISITEAQRVLQITDRVLEQFPEVKTVLGKAGRAESATDPAPLSMMETLIILKPKAEWPRFPTWYSSWCPEWARPVFRRLTSDTITKEELVSRMNARLTLPGLSNTWTMPIKGRIDMLSTGIKSPLGIKISGPDPATIERIGSTIERLLPRVKGTRSSFAERVTQGAFLDFRWNREKLALYGLSIDQVQSLIENAIGGKDVTTVVHGQERYPVSVRYMRDFRSDLDTIRQLVVSTDGVRQFTVGDLADIEVVTGPSMIRDENGLTTGYVYLDIGERDTQSYVTEAQQLLRSELKTPPGYTVQWSGEFESIARVRDRLKLVAPLTLGLVILLLFMNTQSVMKTLIVLLAVPFSAVGAVWYLYFAGYHMSTGVWVGLIALVGVDAGTGVFMLLYLDLAYKDADRRGCLRNLQELRIAIKQGSAKRLRPKFMTFATTCIGLVPIMLGTGTGSDVMKRIAAPLVGGIITSFLLELILYPAIYEIWRWHTAIKFRPDAMPISDSQVNIANAVEI